MKAHSTVFYEIPNLSPETKYSIDCFGVSPVGNQQNAESRIYGVTTEAVHFSIDKCQHLENSLRVYVNRNVNVPVVCNVFDETSSGMRAE